MHACARVSEPHGLCAHRSHRRHCLHGRRVARLSFCFSAQLGYMVVECCVVSSDECRDDEEGAAHRESVWKIAP
eukprot:4626665-Pleurochrysis_carterae.AAC.1